MVHTTTAGRITQKHVAAVATHCAGGVGQCDVIAVVGLGCGVGEAGEVAQLSDRLVHCVVVLMYDLQRVGVSDAALGVGLQA